MKQYTGHGLKVSVGDVRISVGAEVWVAPYHSDPRKVTIVYICEAAGQFVARHGDQLAVLSFAEIMSEEDQARARARHLRRSIIDAVNMSDDVSQIERIAAFVETIAK
jgi:hypothetical protein